MTDVTGTIYGLVDPRDDVIRYIGQTVKPIEARLAGHLAAPAPRVRAWIEELAVDGAFPRIVAIREAVPAADLDRVEREEILSHAGRVEILNTVGNDPGNAKRRKASREEAKRRKIEEEAVDRAWRQATWRQVADQIRNATGGPISPADIPVREIPGAVWDAYQAYRDARQELQASARDGYPLRPGFGVVIDGSTTEGQERRATRQRLMSLEESLDHYLRAYCGAFSRVDDGDRWGSGEGVSDRGLQAYRSEFRDPSHMARYLSLLSWAARALDPWVELAKSAEIDVRGDEFIEWVSDDQETRDAVDLYRSTAPGYLGVVRQTWDRDVAAYALALGASHIPGFVVPHLLERELQEQLTRLARDRQATRAMCQLLQRIDPEALNAVYGSDELAEADEALGLPTGTSARVARRLYGGNLLDPADRTAKLLQRHTGEFDVTEVPSYDEWKGIHIPALRVTAASFYAAGLFPEAGQATGEELIDRVRASWKPTARGLERIEELDARLKSRAA